MQSRSRKRTMLRTVKLVTRGISLQFTCPRCGAFPFRVYTQRSACRAITKEHSRPIPDGGIVADMYRPLSPILRKLLVITERSCSKFRGGSKERWTTDKLREISRKTAGNALRDSAAANTIVYCAARRVVRSSILLHRIRIKRRLINTPLRGNIKVLSPLPRERVPANSLNNVIGSMRPILEPWMPPPYFPGENRSSNY